MADKPKKAGIADYIEKNHKLLSAMGIFTALTVFANNLAIKPIGYTLSFMFLMLTVLVAITLWRQHDYKNESQLLILFHRSLLIITFLLALYWLIDFRTIWHDTLWMVIWIILLSIYVVLVARFTEKYAARPLWQRLIYALVIIAIFVLLGYGSYRISGPINRVLDSLYEGVTEIDSP